MSLARKQYAELFEALFQDLKGEKVDDECLLRLYQVFGNGLMAALVLVDKGEVIKISLPNNRYIYQVSSSSGIPYTIYPTDLRLDMGFCPCKAFGQAGLVNGSMLLCKHLLAVKLAERTGRLKTTSVDGENIPALLGLSKEGYYSLVLPESRWLD